MKQFFSGNNLIKTLKNSTFGIFENLINQLEISRNELHLPSIIIIGNESSGKSSLIQNILKCNIFPTDRRTCTKMPIKLDLINSSEEKYLIIYKNETIKVKNKEDILKEITEIMKDIGENKIVEDEINIKFYHPEVINNTFYDLPGIREYPESLKQKTINITNKYINKPNTLIICVIPSSVTRLTSNQALGLVINQNKCKECIIALTMVDLLHKTEQEELLINRLLGLNNKLKNINIYKIIGLINKIQNEEEWFNINIINYIIDIKIKNNLTSHITLNKLLLNLDNLYHNYIRNNWKPYILQQINNSISKYNLEYKELGSTSLCFDHIYNYIFNTIKFYNFKDFYNYKNNNWTLCDSDINKFNDIYLNIKLENEINKLFKESTYKLYRFNILQLFLLKLISNICDTEFNKIDICFNHKI